jgi:hypothetical protein
MKGKLQTASRELKIYPGNAGEKKTRGQPVKN